MFSIFSSLGACVLASRATMSIHINVSVWTKHSNKTASNVALLRACVDVIAPSSFRIIWKEITICVQHFTILQKNVRTEWMPFDSCIQILTHFHIFEPHETFFFFFFEFSQQMLLNIVRRRPKVVVTVQRDWATSSTVCAEPINWRVEHVHSKKISWRNYHKYERQLIHCRSDGKICLFFLHLCKCIWSKRDFSK